MAKDKCKSCGVKWTDHYGIQPTCAALQTALKTLRQISTMPRQRRARQLAGATVAFLETQLLPPNVRISDAARLSNK